MATESWGTTIRYGVTQGRKGNVGKTERRYREGKENRIYRAGSKKPHKKLKADSPAVER